MSDAISPVVDGNAVIAEPPKAEVVAKAEPVSKTRLLQPGELHTYKCDKSGLVFKFMLPPEVSVHPVLVKFCDYDPMWLGRNAAKMRTHLSICEAGVVAFQPSGKGWKANVFPFGRFTVTMPEIEDRWGDALLGVRFYDKPTK